MSFLKRSAFLLSMYVIPIFIPSQRRKSKFPFKFTLEKAESSAVPTLEPAKDP